MEIYGIHTCMLNIRKIIVLNRWYSENLNLPGKRAYENKRQFQFTGVYIS